MHKISTAHTNEEAVAGKTSGLMEINDSVTWRAKHLGIYQKLTSKITDYNRPNSFTDEMQKGAFKSFKHVHLFNEKNGITLMTDIFEYQSPFGVFGNLADFLFLKKYITKLLEKRNLTIKEFAESEKWREVLLIPSE
ncbi:MAG TPA: SRPBCC family protein [Brumimicrobium sp.]|nr:SRPBCC family protein [Brumimicrobium sp.]